jgi:hypothetical protein
MTLRVILIIDHVVRMRLEHHISIFMLSTVDDEVLPIIADSIFTLDTGQG